MTEQRPTFNPKEQMETEKWYKMTLVFAQSGGEKETEDGSWRWVKYPIRFNGEKQTSGWFLKPDYATDVKLIALLGEWDFEQDSPKVGMVGIEPGSTFEIKRFLWENPKTKKASQQFAIRFKGQLWDTIVGAKTGDAPVGSPLPQPVAKSDQPKEENPPQPTKVDDAIALAGEVLTKYIRELKKVAREHDLDDTAWEKLYSHTHVSTILINLNK